MQCKLDLRRILLSAISTWLLSVAGIIILGVLCEMIIPDGQMNKYVKTIFSFAVLLVLIMPLPNIFRTELDINSILEFNPALQENYLEQVNLDKLNLMSNSINKQIKDAGIEGVEVYINSNIFSSTLEVYGVGVNLKNMKSDVDKSTAKTTILKIIRSFKELSSVEVNFEE